MVRRTAHNDITGDKIQTRDKLSEQGEQNFESIFGKRKTNGGWTPPTESKQRTPEEERARHAGYEVIELGFDLAKPTSTPTQPAEYAEDWQSVERDRAIAQNGNIGYESNDVEGTPLGTQTSSETTED